jgi:hypothetical protein
MKKIFVSIFVLAAAMPVVAQETYENAKIATEDLNGTARYVGMGGAMDALGADISTIGSNPAGIGLFRKSSVSTSFGFNSQEDAKDFAGSNKTRMSFDQIGFVLSMRTGESSYTNFAFNYHKSRNFGFILSAADNLPVFTDYDGNKFTASQNKLTYEKAKNGLLYDGMDSKGWPNIDKPFASCNQLDDMYTRNLNFDTDDNAWYYDEASAYTLNRNHKGYIGEYDFNLSGNVNDRFYWGLTVGVHGVHYKHYGEYKESLDGFNILVNDDREISGTGFDIKGGIIIRPIEESPFRFGLSVATPTFYNLTTENSTSILISGNSPTVVSNSESLDYKLWTPWKFGLSLGHTVGQMLALGAGFEYADYGSLDTRYGTGRYYDYWTDTYRENSRSDSEMNRHTEQTLKGVYTLKLGAELKPIPEMAVRLGYNYVSPMYNEDGFKDGTIQSEGSYYSSATDFTNWKGTNRITCGLGYQFGDLNLAFAYQYSTQKGEFMPFMSYVEGDHFDVQNPENNICDPVEVKNNRHQVLFTVGYTF